MLATDAVTGARVGAHRSSIERVFPGWQTAKTAGIFFMLDARRYLLVAGLLAGLFVRHLAGVGDVGAGLVPRDGTPGAGDRSAGVCRGLSAG